MFLCLKEFAISDANLPTDVKFKITSGIKGDMLAIDVTSAGVMSPSDDTMHVSVSNVVIKACYTPG